VTAHAAIALQSAQTEADLRGRLVTGAGEMPGN
jgi:hypothetical protein